MHRRTWLQATLGLVLSVSGVKLAPSVVPYKIESADGTVKDDVYMTIRWYYNFGIRRRNVAA